MKLADPQPSSMGTENNKKKKKKREKLEATVQVVDGNPDKTPPIVAYFPSGYAPSQNSDVGVRVFQNTIKTNRMEVVVSPPDSNVEFVGSSYSGEPTAGQPCTYALGVLDKESKTLRVLPIASNKILRMEPRVISNIVDDTQSEVATGELSAKDKADRLRESTNLYGTKKSIQQAKKSQALRQEDDPNSQKDLDRKIKDVAINKGALESTSAQNALNIPPYNSSATVPRDAYPLDKIILKGEWDYIRDLLELLNAGGKVSSDGYPTFVCNRIYKLESTQDEFEKEMRGCIFSYITHLIKFKDQHSADGASSARSHKIPSILRQKFLSMFSESQSKWLPSEKIDLLISYVLVLTLFADDFQTDPADIAKDLRMSSITLRQHFEKLGCKFSRDNGILYATLPVPLHFPEIRKRRRRGG